MIYGTSMKTKPGIGSPETLSVILRMGQAIQQARKRRRLTQKQLAQRAAIGLQTMARLERGEPGIALASYLEVLMVLDRRWPIALHDVIESDPAGHALETNRLPKRVVPDVF